MKLRNLLVASTLIIGGSVSAQVGIGNPNPDSSSVLDLTNPNNKGLILPAVASPASMAANPVGLVYFFNDKIFYKESGEYNALSPWKYKYGAANLANENIYYDGNGKIGIGMPHTDIPQAIFHIKPSVTVSLSSNGSFMIGDISTNNLAVNGEAIQSRNNGSAADLTINDAGGNVRVGGKVQQKSGGAYYDLVPAGTIVMWSGASLPGGWVLCNGASGTPNLTDRFIRGGSLAQASTTGGSTGGSTSTNVTLYTSNMPSHSHSFTGSTSYGGSHNHNWASGSTCSGTGCSNSSNIPTGFASGAASGITTTTNGSHLHSFSGTTASSGSGSAFNVAILPSFYRLAYIMKL